MLSKIVSEILGAGAELRNDKLNTHHNKKLREKILTCACGYIAQKCASIQ